MNKKLLIGLGIFSIVILAIFVAIFLNYFTVIEFFLHPYFPIKPSVIQNRALVVVVEDNDFVQYDEEAQIWYDNNKSFVDLVLSLYLRIPKSEFKDKTMTELVDDYVEPFYIKSIVENASSYKKIVVLTDKDATLDIFKQSVENLTAEKYTTDVFIHLHGGTDAICFYNYGGTSCESVQEIREYLIDSNLNLGFVYSVSCYGSETMKVWTDIGAKVSNGSKLTNSIALFAPPKFMQDINSGKTFNESVQDGYNFEIELFSKLSIFSKSIKEYADTLNGSKSEMLISGDSDYKIR
jgi:hypothetical protein